MPCQYNEASSFDPLRELAHGEVLELRRRLRMAKKRLNKGDPKKGRQWWAFEIQHLEAEIRELMPQLRPTLVKG